MSSTDRQSRLLVTEDWKKIYQSFRNADFQSYDFDNLRRTMINYLRQNYPEDFNDYIESSEYLALIDLIAFLGQNLSFRIDLNARENFLETAERRESVLRLAKLISYNPARNKAANGLLKFDTVSTTESIKDSTGVNLAGTTVQWNDRANPNYFEQFIKIINSALPADGGIGNPLKTADIQGVSTEQYRFNALNNDIPVFGFNKQVEGVSSRFEITSTVLNGNTIIEEAPLPGNNPCFLYRDDGQGAGSSNTGFFMHFRQGTLESSNFTVDNPVPNQVVAIDEVNINDTDVWVYNTDSNGLERSLWTRLDSLEGNNIIYASIFKDTKNVYSVSTRTEDRINLLFSDGVFGNLPAGNFRIYYRSSDNRNMIISPNAITGINIEIPYISKANRQEVLTIGMSLKTTVSNSRPSESNADIKADAPATYYTQNRLITAEDYNIGPLGIDQDIIKTKTVNRVSSGISKYLDLKDPTGKYSKTELYAGDGILYKEEYNDKFKFDFVTQADIEGMIYTQLESIINSANIKSFYQQNFNRQNLVELNANWVQVSRSTNRSTGYLQNSLSSVNYTVGSFQTNNLSYLEVGALCKFRAPTVSGVQQYFLENNTLTDNSNEIGASLYKWTVVQNVSNDGTRNDDAGLGAITFNEIIPEGSQIVEILPKYTRSINEDTKRQIVDRAFVYKDFGLTYDQTTRSWKVITAENIDTFSGFSIQNQGNSIGANLDASWIFYFQTDGATYTVTYRNLRYVFESQDEIKFFFDSADKIYDPKTGKTEKDSLTVLNINPRPNSPQAFNKDFVWSISDAFRDSGGYKDTRKIQLAFFDTDDDGVADNPDIFKDIVDEFGTLKENRFVFQKKYSNMDGVDDYRYFDNSNSEVIVLQNENDQNFQPSLATDGQVYYYVDFDLFRVLNKEQNNMTVTTDYKAHVGRDKLKFKYVHVADQNYRIDPSRSNILDTYLLTRGYDQEIRRYLNGDLDAEPLPPSTDELFNSYGAKISRIKSISDEVVYHPVKYKILFGNKADKDLQVTFKIVKNPELSINNNELKAEIISLINRYFSIENWDFGETFYFQELATYVMNNLTPDLVSFLIVPKKPEQTFGSLFEIKSESDEIFISGAKVSDIEIITEHTASNLQTNGKVISAISPKASGIVTRSSADPTILPSTTVTNTIDTGNTGGTLNPPMPLQEIAEIDNTDPFANQLGNIGPVDPTYTLSVVQIGANDVSELSGPFVIGADEAFVIQLQTTDIADNTVITYNITGVESVDISDQPLTGAFTIDKNNAQAAFQMSVDSIGDDRPTTFKLTLNIEQENIELTIREAEE